MNHGLSFCVRMSVTHWNAIISFVCRTYVHIIYECDVPYHFIATCIVCLIPLFFMKSANSLEVNCSPLLETNPHVANVCRSTAIVLVKLFLSCHKPLAI